MSNKSRQGIRPAFLAAVLGVAAMLAVVAVLALPSGPAHAQSSPFDPPAPTGVNAAANSDGTEVTVTWTAGTRGTRASGYEVERKVGAGDWMSADPAHTGDTPSYTDSNVSDGITYTYRVRATNNFGQSGWVASNEVTVTMQLAQLDMPANVMVADQNPDRALAVSWDAVEGAGGYKINWSPASSTGASMYQAGSDATSYTIANLAPETDYTIMVVALGVDGESRDSVAASTQGTTNPVAYDLLLSHETDSGSLTCPERSAGRPACVGGDEFAGGDFAEINVGSLIAPNLIDKATIRTDDRVTIHAEVQTDSPEDTTTVTIRIENSNGTGGLDEDPGITYFTSGLNAPGERSIEDGTLDIQIRDEASRIFDVHVDCSGMSAELTGTLDLEVRDDRQALVAQATITCEPPEVPPTPEERVSACYTISAMPDRGDDPNTVEVEGEDIELLTTDKSVQLTVSAFEKTYKTTTVGSVTTIEDPEDCPDWDPSSVFIRLVDQPGAMPMVDDDGGFVDENGLINDHGQVVGVSSGGELMLDIETAVPAPREGDDDINVVRGTFRVFTPADVEMGDRYFVELYDNLNSNRIKHQNALTGAEQDYERVVYCSDPASAAGACEEPPNNAPVAVGSIAAQTVTAGQSVTVDVASNFSDADMDDTLTYRAMSNMTSYATVSVSGSMVSITGVAAGMATITVTAADGNGGTDTQTFDVNVESAVVTAASDIEASHDGVVVTITWDGGENADKFTVALLSRNADGSWDIANAVYDTGVSGSPHTVNMATRPAGTYLVFVAAGTDDGEWSAWASGSLGYQPQDGPPQLGG